MLHWILLHRSHQMHQKCQSIKFSLSAYQYSNQTNLCINYTIQIPTYQVITTLTWSPPSCWPGMFICYSPFAIFSPPFLHYAFLDILLTIMSYKKKDFFCSSTRFTIKVQYFQTRRWKLVTIYSESYFFKVLLPLNAR